MRPLAGTSGFSYDEWEGVFYPEDLPSGERLAFYASKLPAVEINNTFYRMPRSSVVAAWAGAVPSEFRFVFKAPQRISHHKRLKDAGEELHYLLEQLAPAGERTGALLVQCPPNLKKDAGRLAAFLEQLPATTRAAFEFRQPSWFEEEVYAALRAKGCALVLSDVDGAPEPPLVPTARWGYLRLRRTSYTSADLARWVETIRAQPWEEVFVFFKHEEAGTGPRLAREFLERFGGETSGTP